MKSKRIIVLLLTLLACMCAATALADAHLMENGSVLYRYIEAPDELRDYIDGNGAYASQDELEAKEQYTNAYRIVLEEPGTLVICPLSYHNEEHVVIYSDFQLMNAVNNSFRAQKNSRSTIYTLNLDAGTYYYRGEVRYGTRLYADCLTVYIGFIPSSGLIPDQTLQTDEDTYERVSYITVSSDDELALYIDSDGTYTNQDVTNENINSDGYMPVYAVTIDEPGTLVFAPLSIDTSIEGFGDVRVYIYSNAALTSLLMEADGIEGTYDGFYLLSLSPGTYYYYGRNRHIATTQVTDWSSRTFRNFIGFIPDDNNDIQFELPVEKSSNMKLNVKQIETLDDIESVINDSDPVKTETFSKKGYGDTYCISIDEPGTLFVQAIGNKAHASLCKVEIFSDISITSCILSEKINDSTDDVLTSYPIALNKGNYYLRLYGYPDGGSASASIQLYLEFIPSSHIISVANQQVINDGQAVQVDFNIADEYNPDQQKASVRIVGRWVGSRSMMVKEIWKDDTRENAIESHTFIATENGTYTARVYGNGLIPYMCTFEVTGIGTTPEEAPVAEDAPADEAETPEEAAEATEEEADEESGLTREEMEEEIERLKKLLQDFGIDGD